MKRTNYIGRRNEKIVIIKETREKEGNAVLVGKCDCGKERTFSATQIKKVKSCLECRVKYDQTKEFEYLLGQKINNFTVEKKLSSNGGKLQWLCRCDCDEIFKLSTTKIINGKIKHCPKCSTKIRVNNRTNDISGQTFNYLKVLRREPNKSTRVAFYCKCLLCNKD